MIEGDTVDASQDETIVRCSHLSKIYYLQSSRSWLPWSEIQIQSVDALSDVTAHIHRGETVGIAGPSGSGKSTFLHLIAGLLMPTSGKIEVIGRELQPMSNAELAQMRNNHIGLVFQRFHLIPSLSARGNVALPLLQLGAPKGRRRKRAEELLDRVGLGDRILHSPGQLSGGERQRVAIARALVTDPDLVLADEPTGELDASTGMSVLKTMINVASDRAVVIASHDDAALKVADRVLRLRDGRLQGEHEG